MKHFIQTITEIPSKSEISKYSDEFVQDSNVPNLEKYLTLKTLEALIKETLPKLNGLAKDNFLEMFNGTLKQDAYGVTIQLVDMSKSITLKDPTYEYSNKVLEIERDIRLLEDQLKFQKDLLKLTKTQEINNGTAKKLDEMFTEPKEAKENFQLKITLRK